MHGHSAATQVPSGLLSQIPPQPWQGPEQLVVGIDVGTTLSAASISHFIPGAIPKHRVVTRWPETNQPKVPTVGLYDPKNGACIAWGAEAKSDSWTEDLLDGKVVLAKAFKASNQPSHWFSLSAFADTHRTNSYI